MNWARYKQLCGQPDYWSRWMLEQSMGLLRQLDEQPLQLALDHALRGDPLPPPEDHRGGDGTLMYRLTLSVKQRHEVLAAVREARAKGLETAQTQGRGLGGFVEAWQEYAEFE